MEPVPGPCSSSPPPGPRPVPPPRKGSIERRAPRDSADGRGHGVAPSSPERGPVTQTVLIVMESRASVTPGNESVGPPGAAMKEPTPPLGPATTSLGSPIPVSGAPTLSLGGPIPDSGAPTPSLGGPVPTLGGPSHRPAPEEASTSPGGPIPASGTPTPNLGGPIPAKELPSPSLGGPVPTSGAPLSRPAPENPTTSPGGAIPASGAPPPQPAKEGRLPRWNIPATPQKAPEASPPPGQAMLVNGGPQSGRSESPITLRPGTQSTEPRPTSPQHAAPEGPTRGRITVTLQAEAPKPPGRSGKTLTDGSALSSPAPAPAEQSVPVTNPAVIAMETPTSAAAIPATVAMETRTPACITKETVIPAAVTMETRTPASITTETVIPAAVTMETCIPSSVTKETVIPAAVTMETHTPASITTETVISAAVAMETRIPSSVTTETVIPATVAMETRIPSSVTKETVIPAAVTMEIRNPAAVPTEAHELLAASMESTKQNSVGHSLDSGGPSSAISGQNPLPAAQATNPPSDDASPRGPSLSPARVADASSPHRNVSSKPPLPLPPRSALYPGHAPSIREPEPSLSCETSSLSSFRSKAPAPDTLSYLDSVSLMSGTLESLSHLDDASSLGSDSEINGAPYRKTDKYGFLGGSQFSGLAESAIPVEIARARELKWLDMFNHWEKWVARRFQKVKLRCRKGIPSSLRARAWQYLSNSQDLLNRNPGKFEELEREPGDPKWLDVIEKDLHRQFPFHEMFAARGGHGQQDLYRILKAYTVYRPEEGYCQAQAPVAAVLLMHMPAEQAFWCLVQICDKYLPGYYSAGLEAIQLDGEIFFALLRRICPMAYRHLKKFKIDPILYMTEWFMCIFSRTLPWSSVLRVWDMFFCEGVKIVFRVGLVLLRHTLGSVDKLRACQGMYETMEKLRALPPHCMQEEVLLPEVSSLPVTDALIERESNTQLRKWRENRGELQYRPSRRLHGARQIYEEKQRLNPSLSGSRLSLSSLRKPSPPPTPTRMPPPPQTLQPESLVVSEGLRPVLPSPTSNKAPLGPPKEASTKKGKEKAKEQDKKREKEERERERQREKEERERQRLREKEEREERERERRREKEREKQREKEEKQRAQKEKAEAKPKRERKFSFRRKEPPSPAADSAHKGGADNPYF